MTSRHRTRRRHSPGPGLTSGLFHSNGNAAIFIQNAPVYRAPPQAALPSYRSENENVSHHTSEHGADCTCGKCMMPQQSMWLGADTSGTCCRSSIDGLYKIARHEGLQSLWRGTDAAVLLTVPLVAIYLPLYDHLLEKCSSAGALLCWPAFVCPVYTCCCSVPQLVVG